MKMFRSKAVVFVTLLLLVSLCFGLLATVSAQPVKLVVWGRDLPDDDPAHAYVKALVTGFKANNPDIDLEYVALGDPGLTDKTKVVMASGSGLPDVFQSWGGSVMGGYADAGRLLDLTAELKDLPCSPAAREAMSWKGKIYGVAPFFAIAGLFVNEDLFDAYGYAVPTTLKELEEVADAFLTKGIQPFACGARDKWPVLAFYMYLTDRYGGIETFADAQARRGRFDSEPFVKAAQHYQDWVKKGYFGDMPLSEAYGDAQQLMATGKAAMHITGSWMCAQYSDEDFTDQTIGFYAFPVLEGGKGKVTDIMGQTDIGFAATHVAADKKEAVVRFLKYTMDPEPCAAEPGRICSVPGVPSPSRLNEMASAVFGTAEVVQFWWDQDLPPMLTAPLNDAMQNFFIPDADVKSVLTEYEWLVEDHLGPAK